MLRHAVKRFLSSHIKPEENIKRKKKKLWQFVIVALFTKWARFVDCSRMRSPKKKKGNKGTGGGRWLEIQNKQNDEDRY
jgi:hypothetical protein